MDRAVSEWARLPKCQLGAVEGLIFFPNHTQWPRFLMRLMKAGWKYKEIAMAQLYARDKTSKLALKKRDAALRHQGGTNGRIVLRDQGAKPGQSAEDFERSIENFKPIDHHGLIDAIPYDTSGYKPRKSSRLIPEHYSLLEIAKGVRKWPAAEDSGVVTQVIRYARDNNLGKLTTADIDRIARQEGFTMPEDASGNNWDQNGRERILQTMATDGVDFAS